MLKGIPEILSPELLKVLCEMGHSDRLVIADGNFPVESMGKNAITIRCDGHGVPEILEAILKVFPLDTYVAVSYTHLFRHLCPKCTLFSHNKGTIRTKGTVSYTHLDVYKRQVQRDPAPRVIIQVQRVARNGGRFITPIRTPFSLSLIHILSLKQNLIKNRRNYFGYYEFFEFRNFYSRRI